MGTVSGLSFFIGIEAGLGIRGEARGGGKIYKNHLCVIYPAGTLGGGI